jgi:hypothetical protein
MYRTMPPIGCFLSLLVALAGCELDGRMIIASRCFDTTTNDFFCCDEDTPRDHPACNGGADAGADGDADAANDGNVDAGSDDGGPPATVCPWACTPTAGGGFDAFPSYVWFEKEGDPQPLPLDGLASTSWLDVEFDELTCPTCSCVAPTNPVGGCVLPMVWSVESTVCQDPSSPIVTPFDPPLNWTGSCTSSNLIEAGFLCDGAPCVKSLVVQPPAIAPCVAHPAMPAEGQTPSPPSVTTVIEYGAATFGQACGLTSNCIAPPPAGYKLCLIARNDDAVEPCPKGWPDRYEGWRDVFDTRACTPCTCGSPEGASCVTRVKAYADDACVSEAGSLLVSSDEEAKCTDLLVGTALGSKTAEILSYQSGSCLPSTSEIVGSTATKRPVTFCCVTDPEMPK